MPLHPIEYVTATDDTWKLAVHRLIGRADVILVDLRAFGVGASGVEYELREIVGRVPVGRVLLVVDDSTDMAHLESVLEACWQEMPAASPNRRHDPSPVRIYRFARTLADFDDDDELTWDMRFFGVSLNPRSESAVGRAACFGLGGRDAGVLTRLALEAAAASTARIPAPPGATRPPGDDSADPADRTQASP